MGQDEAHVLTVFCDVVLRCLCPARVLILWLEPTCSTNVDPNTKAKVEHAVDDALHALDTMVRQSLDLDIVEPVQQAAINWLVNNVA